MLDVRLILQEKPGSFLGYFLPLLILSQENDKLLDVIQFFGLDKLVECVELLGGSKVEFPTWATVDALVSDAYLLYLLDKKTAPKTLETIFDASYDSLVARSKALRSTLKTEAEDFPGEREAEKWHRRVKRIKKEIAEATISDVVIDGHNLRDNQQKTNES